MISRGVLNASFAASHANCLLLTAAVSALWVAVIVSGGGVSQIDAALSALLEAALRQVLS